MKSIKIILAAIAIFTLLSCSKDDKEQSVVQKKVTVKIQTVPMSKASDKTSVAYGTKTPVNDVVVYFLDGNDQVVDGGGTMTGSEITSGKTFTDVGGSAVKAYIVANTINTQTSAALFPGLSSIGLGNKKQDIEIMTANINTQMDNTDMGISNVVLSGEATLQPVDAVNYTANVTVSPVVCRFEIKSITGKDKITAFNLDGIYLNTYYPGFTIGGSSSGTYYGLSTSDADLDHVASYMKDENINMTGSLTYSLPGTNKVWAYMVPVANTTPKIIFQLEDISVNGLPFLPKVQYITVNNFRNATTLEPLTLKRGEVYVVKDVQFEAKDLTDHPNAQNINVEVFVDVKGWDVYLVDPLL